MTKTEPRLRLTDKEWEALISASVAWDGFYMDEVNDEAGARRERAALDRALRKIRTAARR